MFPFVEAVPAVALLLGVLNNRLFPIKCFIDIVSWTLSIAFSILDGRPLDAFDFKDSLFTFDAKPLLSTDLSHIPVLASTIFKLGFGL